MAIIMSDPNWSRFRNPRGWSHIISKELKLGSELCNRREWDYFYRKEQKCELGGSYELGSSFKFGGEFRNPREWDNFYWMTDNFYWKEQEFELGREFRNPRGWIHINPKELKFKLALNLNGLSSAYKSSFIDVLLDPLSCAGIPRLIVLDHSKSITGKGDHKAWEEFRQCEGQLRMRQNDFFQKIEWGDWYKGEIENEFEGLKLSLKMLEMLKHLVQSTLIEPMRDAVVLMTLMYIVVLAYSLAQVRNDWLIHFLVLCAFFCLHIGSYFSEKAANYFYRVNEMEKKSTERWPHEVVLYLHLASPTCILLST